MTFSTPKALACSLIPVISLFQLGAAGTASAADDLMQMQRDLLAGRVVAQPVAAHAERTIRSEKTSGDAQALAREMILASGRSSGDRDIRVASRETPVRGDAQELARNVILSRGSAFTAGT
jgi:hypothetical protein